MEIRRPSAIVTGAGSGIGAATVAVLAREGWRVACLDRDAAAAERVAVQAGKDHVARAVDVADEAAMIATIAEAAAVLGGLDGLATCAGVHDTTPFMAVPVETFRRLYDINVIGTYLAIREAARHMRRGGRICTVTSVAGLRGGGVGGTVAYAASKGALIALTKSAARALAEQGIAVNTVAPGPIETPMFDKVAASNPGIRQRIEGMVPQGRVGTAEEVAEAIGWLLSPKAGYIDGVTLAIDGGLAMP